MQRIAIMDDRVILEDTEDLCSSTTLEICSSPEQARELAIEHAEFMNVPIDPNTVRL